METFRVIYKVLAGVAVGYTVHKLLEDKSNKLVHDGGGLNAFTVGAGQMGISMTVGCIAARVLG